MSAWAKKDGVSSRTAWRWFRSGILPVPARQLPTGTILVEESEPRTGPARVGIDARVSSADQKQDLEQQAARLVAWATERKWAVVATVTEVGSGLKGKRPKLIKLLADPKVRTMVAEHRDRLMRFGGEYGEAALRASGRSL